MAWEPLFLYAELSTPPPLLLPDTGSRPQAARELRPGALGGRQAGRGKCLQTSGRCPQAPHPTSPNLPKRCWVGSPGRGSQWPPNGLTGPAGPPAYPASATLSFLFWCVLTCLARWSLRMKRLPHSGQAKATAVSPRCRRSSSERCEAFTAEEPLHTKGRLLRVPAQVRLQVRRLAVHLAGSPARGTRAASSCPALPPGRRPPLGSWGSGSGGTSWPWPPGGLGLQQRSDLALVLRGPTGPTPGPASQRQRQPQRRPPAGKRGAWGPGAGARKAAPWNPRGSRTAAGLRDTPPREVVGGRVGGQLAACGRRWRLAVGAASWSSWGSAAWAA